MIAGLPLDTWILMVFSTVPGLILVVAAYRIHSGADIRGPAQENGRESGGERRPEAAQARSDRSGSRG